MASKPASSERDRRLRRLHLEQTRAWAIAWLIGIGSLFAVAVTVQGRLSSQDLDAELGLFSTAVYGLTWFEDDGTFESSALDREPELLAQPFDLWVIEPGIRPRTHLAPTGPRFEIPGLAAVAAEIVASEEDVYVDGEDRTGRTYRLHGIASYDEQDRVKAAILVAADPSPWRSEHAQFVRTTALMTLALVAVGLFVGATLSRRALRPVLDSLDQQQRFLAAAAHELRTPVATLQAVCESPRGEGESAEDVVDRVAGLVRGTGRLVDQLLLLARLDASAELAPLQPTRLDLLVEAALPEDANVALEARETVVEVDPVLLETAVRNLIQNAQVHGHCGHGIPSQGNRTDGEAKLRVEVGDGRIVVEDEGPGFPPDLLERAAEPFVASPQSPGTGLGLAIARQIAERHGGRLTLENRHPRGARVTLDLGRSG